MKWMTDTFLLQLSWLDYLSAVINNWVLFLIFCFPVHPVYYDNGMNAQEMEINAPTGVRPDCCKMMLYVCDFVV